MKPDLDNYKNIDKSANVIFSEKDTFKVFHFHNLTNEMQFFKYSLKSNVIQLFFCLNSKCIVSFNVEHCAINLDFGNSSMVYFRDEDMNLLFKLPPKAELITILISIEYFHLMFSNDGNFLFNFNVFKTEKPIIEAGNISPPVRLILNQLTTNKINDSFRSVYMKGKIYELLSYYFSSNSDNESEFCPYIANEETISKVKQAKEIIIGNISNPPSLSELAKQVGLNIKKLKTDFKQFYGSPVFTFLLNYKMELAKKMLLENQMNVYEIAINLGYSTSSHFIAAFKRKYGITPKQFAKS